MSWGNGLGRRRARRRQQEGEVGGLPAVVLLIQVALAGGRTPRQTLNALGRFASWRGSIGAASAAISIVSNRLDMGASFTDALLAAERRDEVGASTHRVIDALRRSELDGEPVGVHLDILLLELRRQRANALDVAAQRLTVALLFPLVFCILPAFIVLAVVPLVVAALAGLPG